MTRFKSIAVAAFAVLIAATYIIPALPVSAASSAALSIVPKKNYTVEAGKSIKDTLVVRNLDANEPLELTLRVVDFTFTDDGGTPQLMLAEDAPQTTWSLKPFLTIPKTVEIPPKESKTLDMSVSVPAGHGAGSYYSAIVYSSGSSDGGNVGLSASGVTLVFTSIPGKVNENLVLQNFGAYKQPKTGEKGGYNFITTDMPENIAYTLKNGGNVTEAPVGSITLKDMFGNQRSIDDINPNKSLALIGQTRTFTSCIKLKTEDVNLNGQTTKSTACATPDLWPGMYTVSLDAFYGQNGNNTQEIVKTATFWYLPWWFITIVTIIILVIVFFVWRVVNKIRNKTPRATSKFKKPSFRK
jgi:hypothetical protein